MMRFITSLIIAASRISVTSVLLLSGVLLAFPDYASADDSRNISQAQQVVPGVTLEFPKDHGPHLQQSIEWWYLTANLTSNSGKRFGLQWTLFRTHAKQAHIQSPWWDDQLYFAHFALEDDNGHIAFERFARAGQAQVTAFPFLAQIDHWSLKSPQQDFLPLQLQVSESDYHVDLTLDNSPRVLHGEQGFSQKTTDGHASYYYSYPLLEAQGSLIFKGEEYQVSGSAWYDREWSSGLLDDRYNGWEWFSIQRSAPASGALMVFCLRGSDNRYRYCSGSDISASGKVQHLDHQIISLTADQFTTLDNKQYPTQWQLNIKATANTPEQQLTIQSVNSDSRNKLTILYWEGRIQVSGQYADNNSTEFKGIGYVELTGY